MKVGADVDDDVRRRRIVREEIGPDRMLAVDANQGWDVGRGDRLDGAARAVRPVLDRGADQPRRHPRPRRDRPRRRARSGSRPASTSTTGSCSSSCSRPRRSASARSTPAGSAASTRSWRCCCWRPSSACRSARTPAASGCASWSSTSSTFDYIAVSGRLDGRMIEYVDHLHEHFVDPVVIERRRYRLPTHARLQRRDAAGVAGPLRVPDGPSGGGAERGGADA